MINVEVSTPTDGIRVLHVVGEIDMLTAPVLDSIVASQLQSWPRALVLDLSEVGFMSSAGLASLMAARRQAAQAAVPLRVVCSTEPVLRPLTVTGLAALFDLHTELDAALT